MVAYNFQGRFADLVASGRKAQTIRAPRKDGRHAKVGDALQLYTGMRTRQCRKLRNAVCQDVCDIRLEANRILTCKPQELLALHDLDQFARHDGFANWSEMREWFAGTHGLPFRGVLIRWLVLPATIVQ